LWFSALTQAAIFPADVIAQSAGEPRAGGASPQNDFGSWNDQPAKLDRDGYAVSGRASHQLTDILELSAGT
jgi:hypothetical protein